MESHQLKPRLFKDVWRVLLSDFGLNPANVLRRAELAGDLFARPQAHLSTAEYFRLWRALQEEGHNLRGLLNQTCEWLSSHCLTHSSLCDAEISFLLDFEDATSFFRAFLQWTGASPEAARARLHPARQKTRTPARVAGFVGR